MEVQTLSGIRDKLANMAAADAHHDFDKGARGALRSFSNIFIDKGHKDIGTPVQPTGELLNEAEVMNIFLKYFGPGQKSDAVALFREKFLRDGFTAEMPRATDDPVPYEVRSLKISSRIRKSGKDGFTLSPSQFMDFLTADTGRDVAFCIDAISTSFQNIFKQKEPGVAKRTAYFVNLRESVNDGAGKPDLGDEEEATESGEYSVKVQCLDDKYVGDVVYNATDLDNPSIETFYSIFNIALSSIEAHHGIPAIRATYSKGDYSEPPHLIVQNSKNDGNTVKALSYRITTFLKQLVGADYMSYYTLLQRKRSGDWLQVLACLDRIRFAELHNIPIIICTEDIICAAYAYAMGVDLIFTHVWRPTGTNMTENWLLYCRKKVGGEIVPEADRVARTIAGLPKPSDPVPALLGSSYIDVRTAFIEAREAAIARLMPEFSPLVAAVSAAEGEPAIEASIKAVISVYARLVWTRASLPAIEAKGEEALNSLAAVSRYETNLSAFNRVLKGKVGEAKDAIRAYTDQIVDRARGGPKLEEHINRISIFGSFMSMRRSRESSLREHSTGLLTFMYDYLTAEERLSLAHAVELPVVKLTGVSLDKYKVLLEAVDLFIDKKGNGPKVPNWVLVEAVVADALDEAIPDEPVPDEPLTELPDASGAMAGGAQENPIELSSTYGPSIILALRFQNKQEMAHRVENLEGKRHSAITTPILFMHKLIVAMEQIADEQSVNPEFSKNNEYMLQYISQWLTKILRALPGTDIKKEYKDVECFLLGMIFKYESDMKDSADYIEFLQEFVRETYGTSLREYKIRLCPHIAMEPFVFQEDIPYSALIDDLKGLISITLNKLRSYEEDPRRLVELHEKEARVAAAARAVEQADIDAAAAEAADTVAIAAVAERAEEEIASRVALEAAADREANLAEEVNRVHRSAERARFKMGIAQGAVRKAVALASKRGPKNAKREYRVTFSMLRKSRKRGSDDFRGVTRRKVHPA